MTDIIQQALAVFGGAAALAGTCALAVWGIVKVWGEKALNARFERGLTAYKHEQQKELEQLKYKITGFVDRAVKLHAREFEVLPEAWARLCDANNLARSVLSSLQGYPDLDRLRSDELIQFLNSTDLAETEKTDIQEASEKTAEYIRISDRRRMANAQVKVQASAFYGQKNGIFMPADVRKQFQTLEESMWDALVEKDTGDRHGMMPRPIQAQKNYFRDEESLMATLHVAIQSRLWNSQSAFEET